jgi:hypothetical protein
MAKIIQPCAIQGCINLNRRDGIAQKQDERKGNAISVGGKLPDWYQNY